MHVAPFGFPFPLDPFRYEHNFRTRRLETAHVAVGRAQHDAALRCRHGIGGQCRVRRETRAVQCPPGIRSCRSWRPPCIRRDVNCVVAFLHLDRRVGAVHVTEPTQCSRRVHACNVALVARSRGSRPSKVATATAQPPDSFAEAMRNCLLALRGRSGPVGAWIEFLSKIQPGRRQETSYHGLLARSRELRGLSLRSLRGRSDLAVQSTCGIANRLRTRRNPRRNDCLTVLSKDSSERQARVMTIRSERMPLSSPVGEERPVFPCSRRPSARHRRRRRTAAPTAAGPGFHSCDPTSG